MAEDTSPENLRKFLESDDPAMVKMGLSMAKGSGVPEELLGLVAGIYMWHDEKTVRVVAKSAFMKFAPDELKVFLKETWDPKYRTIKNDEKLRTKVEAMLLNFRNTLLDTSDIWVPALSREAGDKLIIISTLRNFDDERVTETLITFLKDEENAWGSEWMGAANALGDIGNTKAVEALINSISANQYSVSKVLAKIGKSAVEQLIKIITDKASWKRKNEIQAIVKTLGEMGDEQAIKPLINILKDENISRTPMQNDIRSAAANALGQIGNKQAVQPLIEVISSRDSVEYSEEGFLIMASIEALGVIGDIRAVELLLKILETNTSRTSVAEALGNIGDARAILPLLNLLYERNWHVREKAAEALGKIGKINIDESVWSSSDEVTIDWGSLTKGTTVVEAILDCMQGWEEHFQCEPENIDPVEYGETCWAAIGALRKLGADEEKLQRFIKRNRRGLY